MRLHRAIPTCCAKLTILSSPLYRTPSLRLSPTGLVSSSPSRLATLNLFFLTTRVLLLYAFPLYVASGGGLYYLVFYRAPLWTRWSGARHLSPSFCPLVPFWILLPMWIFCEFPL